MRISVWCRWVKPTPESSSLIQAVLTGLGVALVPRMLVVDALAGGLLVSPCSDTISVNQGHYLSWNNFVMQAAAWAE